MPSEGTPEAGSRMVKLGCLLKLDRSLTIAEPEIVSFENPGVLVLFETEDACFLGLRRTSGVTFIDSRFLLGVFGTSIWSCSCCCCSSSSGSTQSSDKLALAF